MGDSSKAELFGRLFGLIATDPTEQHKDWARKVWKMSVEYDFYACEMEADKALVKLGLAKDGGRDEDGYPQMVYAKSTGRGWETTDE